MIIALIVILSIIGAIVAYLLLTGKGDTRKDV